MHRLSIPGSWAGAALVALAACAAPARAGYVCRTYSLDQSNVLPDGGVYGGVKIEAYDGVGEAAGGLAAGQVRLTFHAEQLPGYGPAGAEFVLASVGFNTDLALDAEQVALPDGWTVRSHLPMGGFGYLVWHADTEFGPPVQALTLTVSGLGAAATLDHFLIPSAALGGGYPAEQGAVYFAARIGGPGTIDIPDGIHVVGVGVPPPPQVPTEPLPGPDPDPDDSGTGSPVDNPEPSTLLMGALAAAGFGVRRFRR